MNKLLKTISSVVFALLMAATTAAFVGCDEKNDQGGEQNDKGGVNVGAPGVDVDVDPKKKDKDKKPGVDVDVNKRGVDVDVD